VSNAETCPLGSALKECSRCPRHNKYAYYERDGKQNRADQSWWIAFPGVVTGKEIFGKQGGKRRQLATATPDVRQLSMENGRSCVAMIMIPEGRSRRLRVKSIYMIWSCVKLVASVSIASPPLPGVWYLTKLRPSGRPPYW
jgi:hypothetical protein